MKTKQAKEELEKSTDDDSTVEPKTRARKKADEEDKSKACQDEPKTSKEPKKNVAKPKAVVKRKPLGIRKALRSKKAVLSKEAVKKVIKQGAKRGRKPKQAIQAVKTETASSQEKDEIPMIPVSEIKKEPIEDTTPTSRSSSPRGPGRRPRLSSDVSIMKSVLADSSSLVVGPRTSPYSMRSERSNSPSLTEAKNLRRGNPRKAKTNLLNEVVIKEQKKRRRLLSDSKASETEGLEDCKKLKRGRSCSRDGSEISKCSDITESDLSLSESLNDTDSKELKKLDKAKTELDLEIENNVQISTNEKVPSLIDDSKLAESKPIPEPSNISNEKTKKSLSLKRSSSLDSDNNNSNRLKLENLNSSDGDEKSMVKTENDTLFEARSSILNSMSKTFNSKEVSKNMRKARRGRKAAAATRTSSTPGIKNGVSAAIKEDDKQETLESLSKEIDDLINNLDQNIDGDCNMTNDSTLSENSIDQLPNKCITKSVAKALTESNIIVAPETPVKDKESVSVTTESTPSKIDDSENIRLHYEEDSSEKIIESPKEITYKHTSVASIDKLMDRLKEFEELDKRRQRHESESKSGDNKPVMVTNDVVLIPKSGADIKLKDIHTVRSPERPMQKENVMSCFENNSAISLLKRDHVRKSVDVDLTNSVTLIKRNSISARKESTSSNHSKETDAISIFEKSLGKDVTLTEIRKSVDKTPTMQAEIHQFATLHPNNPTQSVVKLDSNQVSILPRISNDVQITKRNSRNSRSSRESLSRKSSESGNDEAMATIEKIKSPPYQGKSSEVSITPSPVAIKSPEIRLPVGAEALPPPLESVKNIPVDITPASNAKPEILEPVGTTEIEDSSKPVIPEVVKADPKKAVQVTKESELPKEKSEDKKMEVDEKTVEKAENKPAEKVEAATVKNVVAVATVEKVEAVATVEKAEAALVKKSDETSTKKTEKTIVEKPDRASSTKVEAAPVEKPETTTPVEKTEATAKEIVKEKPGKASRGSKSARNSVECQPGPSNALHETPESQKRKENVLRTLGLLTHKAAKEAKIEKLKEKERIYSGMINKKSSKTSGDYTGTLKTVIKLNRGTGERDKKRYRSSLKMTFKTKNRGKLQPEEGQDQNEDDTYYTIERREGGVGATTSEGGHRKSYSNRLNNHEGEAAPEPEPKETLNLVIPEKASSFSIHPGRLCMDQCFYCGGKFGLFDTPCHIAQMKSADRQKKVLANEEKLTIDSCLCDACYRHVDRRANCPSYRKRPAKLIELPLQRPQDALSTSVEKVPVSPPEQDESEEEQESNPVTVSGRPAICHAAGCAKQADHSIRRKWLIKMRASVNKLVQLEGDYPGLHTLPLCGEHYRALLPLLACALCRRRITRHHNSHLLHNFVEVNPLLASEGIPVSFSEKPALCKLCRYYCSLLSKPHEHHQLAHKHEYRRKLLLIYNIELPPSPPPPTSPVDQSADQPANQPANQPATQPAEGGAGAGVGGKKKSRGKWKVRLDNRSEEHDRHKEDMNEDNRPIEEDIESLISSNKILVPGAKPNPTTPTPTNPSAPDQSVYDFDPPLVDKQTELQYLLQKQNNPAQFLHKLPDLTKVAKTSKPAGVHKPTHLHRISDKNAKRIHKIGQIFAHRDKKEDGEMDTSEPVLFKNVPLNDECTIESIPNKRPADIDTLKNKWQMSESFSQVKKNLSELSKKLTVEKDPKKSSVKYLNPVKRLETNPSISVRELFPGEEEMNLQCSIEFNNVKAITPEGWEKCNTTIQYDLETKKLWNELQRPYGNQSSFLRHLILLEKYFRSGELVLSPHARPHAANYSDSVQSRLRAYDNVLTDAPRRQEPSISLVEYRKRPSNGKSLLRTNRNDDMPPPLPPPPHPAPAPAFAKHKHKADKAKKQLPPELIAINAPRKAIQSVLHNIQQLVKGVSASDPTELARTDPPPPPTPPPPPPPAPPQPPTTKPDPPKDKPETAKEKTDKPEPVKEKAEPMKEKPDTPNPKEKSEEKKVKKKNPTSKPWRPTLMPITPENVSRIAREPTQTAVDGRQLPSLVQVMSSGKRYHITLQDYNKMCVMRREKLQQLQAGDLTEVHASAMLGNGGTVTVRDREDKPVPELTQISTNAATILKNVGLKNITIAPIPAKTATMTSHTVVSSPALTVTSTQLKLPQLPAVSITSEAVSMPKIPKSLTVIPQTVMTQNIVANVVPSGPFVAVSQGAVVPQGAVVTMLPQGAVAQLVPQDSRP
ncbi:hypothetical protein O0L34_g13874 [Tuta absoluta]|nr:hypothetical protein O0L34_g13874 [Tuta absoluta]